MGRKSKDQKRLEAEVRQAISRDRNRLKQEIARIEEEIDGMETRMKEIEKELAQPATYQDGKQVSEYQREYKRLKKNLEESYDRWEKDKLELEELLNSLH